MIIKHIPWKYFQNESSVTLLISGKIEDKARLITGNKEGHLKILSFHTLKSKLPCT